jgi:hypothetical protein
MQPNNSKTYGSDMNPKDGPSPHSATITYNTHLPESTHSPQQVFMDAYVRWYLSKDPEDGRRWVRAHEAYRGSQGRTEGRERDQNSLIQVKEEGKVRHAPCAVLWMFLLSSLLSVYLATRHCMNEASNSECCSSCARLGRKARRV